MVRHGDSDFNPKHPGDIILFGPKRHPHKIVRRMGKTIVVLEEMQRDRIGRLRGLGDAGRFSTTFASVQAAPLLKRKGR